MGRLLLPVGLLRSANHFLAWDMDTYQGHIDDISLSIYKGAYTLKGLRIWKKDRSDYTPLFSVDAMEVSMLSHLFSEGRRMASLDLFRPHLTVIDSVISGNQQYADGEDWYRVLDRLVPMQIEAVRIQEGGLTFKNLDYRKPVQLDADMINVSAINLHNTEGVRRSLPSQAIFSARIQRDAWVRGNSQFNLYAERPSFSLRADLGGLNLPKLNNMFVLYGPYYFRTGEFGLYSQVYVNQGAVRGYLTPFFKDVDVVKMEWDNRVSRNIVGDSVLALGDLVLQKDMRKAQGRRYAFSGQIPTDVNSWNGFWSTVRTGFKKPSLKNPLALKKKNNLASRSIQWRRQNREKLHDRLD